MNLQEVNSANGRVNLVGKSMGVRPALSRTIPTDVPDAKRSATKYPVGDITAERNWVTQDLLEVPTKEHRAFDERYPSLAGMTTVQRLIIPNQGTEYMSWGMENYDPAQTQSALQSLFETSNK